MFATYYQSFVWVRRTTLYLCNSDFLALQALLIDKEILTKTCTFQLYKRSLLQAIVMHDQCRDTLLSSLNYVW